MKGALWAVDRPSPPRSLLWRISRSHDVTPAVGAKGHSPPVPRRAPREVSAAGPGGGHTSRPEQSARPGPLPSPAAAPLTARSSPGSAPALRPPPPCPRGGGGSAAPGRPHCSGTGGSRPAGPLAAPARLRPGASLKRPRSPRAPGEPGAPRIPYIATTPAKNRAPRLAPALGAGGAPRPRRPRAHPGSPDARPAQSLPHCQTAPGPAPSGVRAAAFPATPRTYPVRPWLRRAGF